MVMLVVVVSPKIGAWSSSRSGRLLSAYLLCFFVTTGAWWMGEQVLDFCFVFREVSPVCFFKSRVLKVR